MMYKNRKRFSGASETIGKAFSFLPANAWTSIALLLALVSAYFILIQQFLPAALLFALTAFLDTVDGAVARYRKEASKKGAYFDTISDRYMEGIIALVLVIVALPAFYLPSYFWASLYLFGSLMTTFSRHASMTALGRDAKGGLLERPERMIILFIGLFLASFNTMFLTYILFVLALVTNITALQRIWIAARK